MATVETVLNAVDRFYDCARGGDDHADALLALCDALSANCATLEISDRRNGQLDALFQARIDESSLQPYAEYYHAISPRVEYGLSADAKPVAHDGDVLTEAEMARDPFYAEFLPPLGLRYFMSIAVDPDPETFAVVAFQFSAGHGPIEDEKLRLGHAMRPHLRRAMKTYWFDRVQSEPDRLQRDLQRRFSLTPAEAMLAMAMLAGLSLAQHADHAGITRNTAYTHYARLKGKLGCRRQVELIALLQQRYPIAGKHH